MTTKEIIQKVHNAHVSPSELSLYNLQLAGEYALLTQEYIEIKIRKPLAWQALRAESKSAAEAEMKWLGTEEGKREMTIHYQRDYLAKLLSSIRKRIDVSQGEIRNQY